MDIELPLGILKTVEYKSTPYCDDRPPDTPIDCLVIHSISLPKGHYGGTYIDDFFCGRLDQSSPPELLYLLPLKVSAHLLIRRQGQITQFVPFSKRAWHAGESSFQGKSHCNDFSIGIELEGTEDSRYETIQYQRLAEVTHSLMCTYPALSSPRITGHSDIAPNRKTDPGPYFDWTFYKALITAHF
ncbi:MAG: 1,6-anhydro-N-acetylmuramyl-L-alanine amidase AmpD [Gammaproteobacteria bacterium]|nr:1,6-anhydro-N-acetylmuramyl-L-alanine amidase AmpD [Gammaproteobacteria bacterium]